MPVDALELTGEPSVQENDPDAYAVHLPADRYVSVMTSALRRLALPAC
ncbi:hypothetical protein ABT121_03830 [Streptomyces sp. NPDC001928]